MMVVIDEKTKTVAISETWSLCDIADTAYPLMPTDMEFDDDALWEMLKNSIGNEWDDTPAINVHSMEAAVYEYIEAHR
jgi:hypothetical protein